MNGGSREGKKNPLSQSRYFASFMEPKGSLSSQWIRLVLSQWITQRLINCNFFQTFESALIPCSWSAFCLTPGDGITWQSHILLLWEPNVHYRVENSPSQGPTLNSWILSEASYPVCLWPTLQVFHLCLVLTSVFSSRFWPKLCPHLSLLA